MVEGSLIKSITTLEIPGNIINWLEICSHSILTLLVNKMKGLRWLAQLTSHFSTIDTSLLILVEDLLCHDIAAYFLFSASW